MKWPWVRRERYDSLYAAYQEARHMLRDSEANGVKLTEILERESARWAPRRLVEPAVPAEPIPPSEIDRVIREQAEGDVELAKHLRRYAQKLRREGLHSPEIVKKLTQWTTTEKLAQME